MNYIFIRSLRNYVIGATVSHFNSRVISKISNAPRERSRQSVGIELYQGIEMSSENPGRGLHCLIGAVLKSTKLMARPSPVHCV